MLSMLYSCYPCIHTAIRAILRFRAKFAQSRKLVLGCLSYRTVQGPQHTMGRQARAPRDTWAAENAQDDDVNKIILYIYKKKHGGEN